MIGLYILRDRKPVRVNLVEWGRWFQAADRKVAWDDLPGGTVSTVFLGIDHGLGDEGPLVFETMIFGSDGEWEAYQERYSTWEDAEAGHMEACKMVKER